jgi:hypothetical protein
MVRMRDLVSALSTAGFTDTGSHLNSGNLFLASGHDRQEVLEEVRSVCRQVAQFEVRLALASADEMRELVKVLADKEPMVSFFCEPATGLPATPLLSPKGDIEIVAWGACYALSFVHGPPGDLKFVEKAAGVRCTARYARVVRELARRVAL